MLLTAFLLNVKDSKSMPIDKVRALWVCVVNRGKWGRGVLEGAVPVDGGRVLGTMV